MALTTTTLLSKSGTLTTVPASVCAPVPMQCLVVVPLGIRAAIRSCALARSDPANSRILGCMSFKIVAVVNWHDVVSGSHDSEHP
jgi:hypothetical protein